MNLNELFDKQRELDARILLEKRLVGQDLLEKKILALQVELGELANEWRGFKFWSTDQEANTAVELEIRCEYCRGNGEIGSRVCHKCDGRGEVLDSIRNPLLEEYVDCLHFILSIGLELGITDVEVTCDYTEDTVTGTFNRTFETIGDLRHCFENQLASEVDIVYGVAFQLLVGLGSQLGFTWEQIEQAYLQKNEINHARQENGY